MACKLVENDRFADISHTAVIKFEKDYDANPSANSRKKLAADAVINHVDCILNYITGLPFIDSLVYHGDEYYPNFFKEIKVDDDIFFLLNKLEYKDGHLNRIEFYIYTQTKPLLIIKQFIDSCIATYQTRIQNKLGADLFFFDIFVPTPTQYAASPDTTLLFTKTKFTTNRTFDNVFFEDRDEVKKRVDLFMNNKGWYDKRGLPHTLGFLLYGAPGCGKTSTIKAIANVTRRHIINLRFGDITKVTQLNKLFFDETLMVMNDGKMEPLTIPIKDRLYIMEDADCMSEILYQREKIVPVTAKPSAVPKTELDNIFASSTPTEYTPKMAADLEAMNKASKSDTITLATVLNILDGTLEVPGRMIVITSNFPDKLDKALLRPGRIDMCVEFRRCSPRVIREMYENFYGIECPSIEDMPDGKWTPAEVTQIFFRNFNTPDIALDELADCDPMKFFRFSHW
jgi:hypothetical protein